MESTFAQGDAYLRDPYSTIGDASHFHTKIVGVSFEGRQDVIAGLARGAVLDLRRQPENPHDTNAIAVCYGALQLGFLKKGIAAQLAPLIDAGARYGARIASLTGGPTMPASESGKHRGVNILLEREASASGGRRMNTSVRDSSFGDLDGIADRIRVALIGAAHPHDAQAAVLERIAGGRNTLAILGTGRGKSFCFQFAAALRALTGAGKTLVIYPLRALANDQYEALRRTLDPLGIRAYRANGSIDADQREELFAALADGSWDIVLATPEFLEFHRDALRGASSPAFTVVDEAHHLHDSRHRASYARLSKTIAALGNPQVLALTATADDEAFRRIIDDLRIDAWVIDPTVRENLTVIDARETRNKHAYLIELFSRAAVREKGIVYCNSRNEATSIARRLRTELGDSVMFYHAKMPNAARLEVERLFRDGLLRIVVATSAFGEGIDLPDVGNVVLYHLNFDFGEFNQQAGRAGRNGKAARIHLLYGQKDRSLNEYLVDLDAPPIGLLREIYRGLKTLTRSAVVHGADSEIAGNLGIERVRERHVAAALRIFADSRLVEIGEDGQGRYVHLLPVRGRVEMEHNERYAEGQATREAFAQFAKIALTASASTLQRVINRPIYPSTMPLRR